MKIREIKKAAKENLRGRWFGPFLMVLVYLLVVLPVTLSGAASGLINMYVSIVENHGIVIEEFAHLDIEMLRTYGLVCSLISLVLCFVIQGPSRVGLSRYFIRLGHEKANLFTFFGGFFKKYFRTIVAQAVISVVMYFLALFSGIMSIAFSFGLAYGVGFVTIVPLMILEWLLIEKSIEYTMLPYMMADYPQMKCREMFRETKTLMRGCKWKLFSLEFSFFGWYLLCVLTLGLALPFFLPYHEQALAEFYHYAKSRQE